MQSVPYYSVFVPQYVAGPILLSPYISAPGL
jgi:hypothetical protein